MGIDLPGRLSNSESLIRGVQVQVRSVEVGNLKGVRKGGKNMGQGSSSQSPDARGSVKAAADGASSGGNEIQISSVTWPFISMCNLRSR